MPRFCKAIIHLKSDSPLPRTGVDHLKPLLDTFPGVRHVAVESTEDSLAVEYDHDLTAIADLIRAIEDAGAPVAGVAQRPLT